MKPNTIFYIEENIERAQTFIAYFEKREDRIIYVSDGEDAIRQFAGHNVGIDFIVMHYTMKRASALDIIKDVRGYSDVPILLQMSDVSVNLQMQAYRTGVDECVSAELPLSLLYMKLEAIGKRVYGAGNILQEGALELDMDKKIMKVSGRPVVITMKEYELLKFFIRNRTKIYSRSQIINSVWGIEYEGSDRAVDSLIKKLRIKMKETASYIHTVYGIGYYFDARIEHRKEQKK